MTLKKAESSVPVPMVCPVLTQHETTGGLEKTESKQSLGRSARGCTTERATGDSGATGKKTVMNCI